MTLDSRLSTLSAARRGVSLLEVLISMGIILSGVLLVATLLPVGTYNLVEASKRSRAVECGSAAADEVVLRQMAEPSTAPTGWYAWYDAANPYPGWTSASPAPTGWFPVPANEGGLDLYQGYVIDPLYIGSCRREPNREPAPFLARFPYTSTPTAYVVAPTTNPSTSPNGGLYLGRVSWFYSPPLPEPPDGTNILAREQQWGFFDRVFFWPDEQLFDIPKDPQSRPTRNLSAAGVGQYDGNFSWMVTVLPQFGAGGAWTGNYDRRVVVFYKRDHFAPPSDPTNYWDPPTNSLPEKPSERMMSVEFTGGGYGGGDVALRTLPLPSPAYYPASWLDIRENEWILVAAWQNLGTVAAPVPRKAFTWFRVEWIEETARQISANPVRYERLATLSSTSDWNRAWRIDLSGDGAINWSPGSVDDIAPAVAGVNPQGIGVICTGVIDVHPIQ